MTMEKIALVISSSKRELCNVRSRDPTKSQHFREKRSGIQVGCGRAVMPRSPRIYVPNGIYHAMNRGNRKELIFEDAHDRRRFIKILEEAAERYGVHVLVECRMGTHYHVVVRTPRANISEFMQFLSGEFAKYSNRRHRRGGHVFGERFKPILVDNGLYLRVLISYVMNNPVAGGLAKAAGDWKWSSYRATIGIDVPPHYLCLDWLESTFPAATRTQSQLLCEQYVNAPSIEDAEIWFQRVVFGTADMKERVRKLINATMYMAAVPRAYRALARPPLEGLLPRGLGKAKRNQAILRAHVVYAYSLADIGRCLGLHPASVSRIISSVRANLPDC
jgi:putative transposase